MRALLLRIAKWCAYPAFYLFCLLLFGYLTFPFGQLKGRIIAEFDRVQQKQRRRARSTGPPMRLEIDELDGHWLTGVEVTGARLVIPPDPHRRAALGQAAGAIAAKGKKAGPPPPSVITIKEASARVRLLPLLVGDIDIDFFIEVFGGQLEGTVPVGADAGDVQVELSGLQLGKVQPLRALLEGLPIAGTLGGSIQLSPRGGKFAKASGTVELHIDELTVADGKTKVQGVALPAAQLGQLVISATAKDGVMKIGEMGTQGRDLDLSGEGKISLRESWDRSRADILVKFRFADGYRDKSDATRSLLGKPGDSFPPAIELAPGSHFKRAKTDDGYYQFHVHGPLAKLAFDPAGRGRSKRPSARGRGKLRRPGAGLPKLGRGRLLGGAGKRTGPGRPPARPGRGKDSEPGAGDDHAAPPSPGAAKPDEQPADQPGSAGRGRAAGGERGETGAGHGEDEPERGKDDPTRGN